MTRKLPETSPDICTFCLCVLQSPTARRCGWWCLWCACQWWLSPSSSLSSSAPWDTTAACRAPRVRDGCQSAHLYCSIHYIITNLSFCQLCKTRRGGADSWRVIAQVMQSVLLSFLFFVCLSVCAWIKTITPHPPSSPCYLIMYYRTFFFFKGTNM